MAACGDGAEMKRSCSDALEELYLYLDGELTEEKRLHIQGHLDDCPPCYEAFDFEAELRIVIQHRCRDEVPDALRRKIESAIHGLHGAGPAAGEG